MQKTYQAGRLRNGRYSQPGQIYLITVVTHQRQCFFQNWQMGRLLVHQMRDAQTQGLAKSLAWVVMPDHLHWLVELENLHSGGLGSGGEITHSAKCEQVSGPIRPILAAGLSRPGHSLRRRPRDRGSLRYPQPHPRRARKAGA